MFLVDVIICSWNKYLILMKSHKFYMGFSGKHVDLCDLSTVHICYLTYYIFLEDLLQNNNNKSTNRKYIQKHKR